MDYLTLKKFYSCLSQKHITPENYKHAKNVYDKLNCKSFRLSFVVSKM